MAASANMAEGKEASASVRELGLHEHFFEAMCTRLDQGHYFQYAVLKSNCPITVDNLKAALEVLVNFQPFLRMTVVEKIEKDRPPTYKASFEEPHTRLYYQPCEVDYTKVIRTRTRKSDDDLAEIVREEEIFLSREERYGDGPRWRVVFNMPEDKEEVNTESDATHRYDLFFGMHHQFVDGVSGYDMVYRQLLPILNKIINDLPVDEIFLHPLDVTPSYEEEFHGVALAADRRPPWYTRVIVTLLRNVNRVFKSRNLGKPALASKGTPFTDVEGSGILKYTFERTLVDRILRERANRDVTVHSILLTSFSFAMIKLFQESNIPLPKEIKSFWPIDSRRKLSKYKSPQPLGLFSAASGFTSLGVPKGDLFDPEVFWTSAKTIGEQVLDGLRHQEEDSGLFGHDLWLYIIERLQLEDFLQVYSEMGLHTDFALSNLGKCCSGPELDLNFPKYVDADEIRFGLHGNSLRNVWFQFWITLAYHKGKMHFVCCYNKLWLMKEIPENLMEYAEKILDHVCVNAVGKENPSDIS